MVLIKVGGSSVNPCDTDWVQQIPGCHYDGSGTPGGDVAGTIVSLGEGAGHRLKRGDRVWANRFELGGGQAEYAIAREEECGIMPRSLSFIEAGTIPVVGGTSLQCLQCLTRPTAGQNNPCMDQRGSLANMTVVITSGSGGTGYLAVQMAKALGAAKVITAATGDAIPWMRSLGADQVVDYKKEEIMSALEDDSVDAVFDNYAGAGTADKAMPKLRVGGAYLLLPHGNCLGNLSSHSKRGVRQISFGDVDQTAHRTLDLMAMWFDAGKLAINVASVPGIQQVFAFEQAAQAYAVVASGTVHGKIAIAPTPPASGAHALTTVHGKIAIAPTPPASGAHALATGDGARPAANSTLPWNAVNLVIVTDVHSWVAAHKHPDHTPTLDASYGDVLSLVERLRASAAAAGRDCFFVQNGDLNDGTGFSQVPPAALVPLLQRLPFDALTTGNHELYKDENIGFLARPGGFIERSNGRFLTSNVLNATTREPLGARFRLLVGSTSGVRLLAFGFLYNMPDHDDSVVVTRVEDAVQQDWFTSALADTGSYDALLFLAHMDYKDPLVDVLHRAARSLVGDAVPMQFVTGHSHIRAYRDLDARAASFEAGRYLDTVGFASFGLGPTGASSFAHVDIEANVAEMAAAAGLDDPAELATPAGQALTADIAKVAATLGLDRLLGCSPRTFRSDAALDAEDSLWALYMHNVSAQQALGSNASRILVESTGSLRYDLYSGNTTVNDVCTMAPFADRFWRVTSKIEGGALATVLHALGKSADGLSRAAARERGPRDWLDAIESGSLPTYAVTSTPVEGRLYDLWALDFDLSHVVQVFEAQTGKVAQPELMLGGENTTSVWIRWIEQNWPCA
jgi:NADPH:quinone reductase-like Zn-dependent oxidoreductase/2',3'-cyclic-nucleotide 2'-phosphodiesterase (5'-nucleotidase family)